MSSGLVTLKNDKKPSYYYLGTLQDMIGEMYLDRQLTTGRDDVMNYLFRNPKGSNGVFTVWKTSGDGSKLDNFSLTLPAGGARIVQRLSLIKVASPRLVLPLP